MFLTRRSTTICWNWSGRFFNFQKKQKNDKLLKNLLSVDFVEISADIILTVNAVKPKNLKTVHFMGNINQDLLHKTPNIIPLNYHHVISSQCQVFQNIIIGT